MPYIGNTVQTQGFAPAIDYFNGNGVTVTFTLSRPVASVAQMIVAIDNVIQNPSSAFGVVGNSITFTSAPLTGTNNIWVEYTSLITTYQGISQDPTVIGDIRATGGYLAEGDFGNSFVDGNLIDYVTGAGRLTVGELDDLVFYHGGTSARSEMMRLSYANNSYITGNLGLGTTTPTASAARFIQLAGAAHSEVRLQSTTTGTSNTDGFGIQMWSDNNVYVWNYENSATIFATNATERMRIGATGIITTPNQPAFRATKNNGGGNSGTGVIVFNQINTNIGSCYNNSNGLFTAPVSGMYQLNFTGITNNDSSTNLSIQVNGSAVCWTYAFFSQTYSNLSMSVATYMSAGDSARVNVLSGNVYDSIDGGSARFSGFLIG